jgi:hypothetical protein
MQKPCIKDHFNGIREIFKTNRETWRSARKPGDSRVNRETWQLCNIANEQYQRKLMVSGDIELNPGPVFLYINLTLYKLFSKQKSN